MVRLRDPPFQTNGLSVLADSVRATGNACTHKTCFQIYACRHHLFLEFRKLAPRQRSYHQTGITTLTCNFRTSCQSMLLRGWHLVNLMEGPSLLACTLGGWWILPLKFILFAISLGSFPFLLRERFLVRNVSGGIEVILAFALSLGWLLIFPENAGGGDNWQYRIHDGRWT